MLVGIWNLSLPMSIFVIPALGGLLNVPLPPPLRVQDLQLLRQV